MTALHFTLCAAALLSGERGRLARCFWRLAENAWEAWQLQSAGHTLGVPREAHALPGAMAGHT